MTRTTVQASFENWQRLAPTDRICAEKSGPEPVTSALVARNADVFRPTPPSDGESPVNRVDARLPVLAIHTAQSQAEEELLVILAVHKGWEARRILGLVQESPAERRPAFVEYAVRRLSPRHDEPHLGKGVVPAVIVRELELWAAVCRHSGRELPDWTRATMLEFLQRDRQDNALSARGKVERRLRLKRIIALNISPSQAESLIGPISHNASQRRPLIRRLPTWGEIADLRRKLTSLVDRVRLDLLTGTGLPLKEVVKLSTDDLVFSEGLAQFHLPHRPDYGARWVTLHHGEEDLAKVVRAMFATGNGPHFFFTVGASNQAMTRWQVGNWYARIKKKTGWKHSMRALQQRFLIYLIQQNAVVGDALFRHRLGVRDMETYWVYQRSWQQAHLASSRNPVDYSWALPMSGRDILRTITIRCECFRENSVDATACLCGLPLRPNDAEGDRLLAAFQHVHDAVLRLRGRSLADALEQAVSRNARPTDEVPLNDF